MNLPVTVTWGAVLLALAGTRVLGCDLCAVYNANSALGASRSGFHLALAEQFTHSGTLQEEGAAITDPVHQFLDSSVTTVIVGYNPHPRWGVSLNVPYIHRSFRRAEGFAVDRGTESGLGDMALVGRWVAVLQTAHEYSYSLSFLGGLEFPTGDSDRLSEEANEVDTPGAPPSGVHGDDLALGSGSFDGIVGVSAAARWRRLLLGVDLQYFMRTEGDFDYQFGNELSVTGGPGVYLLFDEQKTLALHAAFSYETKARDRLDGVRRDEGIASAWYAGPGLTFTWGERFSVTLHGDIPLTIENRGVQTVADYRVRGGISWRF